MHKITPTCLPERNSKKQPAVTLVKLAAAMAATFAFQTAYAGCTASMENINFGNIDLLNPSTPTVQAQLTVTCTRDHASSDKEYVNVCLAIDGGRAPGWSSRTTNPRGLCPNGSCTNSAPLYYNLYTDSNRNIIWGTSIFRATPEMVRTTFTFPSGSNTQTHTIYAKLEEPLSNVVPGTYTIDYADGSTGIAYTSSPDAMPTSCGSLRRIRFPFTVSANIIKSCIVTAPSDIDFGEASLASTNLQGQTTFNVRCTKDTPYTIGMKPSSESLNGTGIMKQKFSLTENTGNIPYQLRAESGMNGRIWGNTANAATIGNGVGGTGTGLNQPHTVYATVRSADLDVPEGYYTDTVTIQVNY